MALNLKSPVLKEIEKNYDKVQDRFREMLLKWLETSEPTVEALADALESPILQYNSLAEKVREDLPELLCPIPSPKRQKLEKSTGEPMNGSFDATG